MKKVPAFPPDPEGLRREAEKRLANQREQAPSPGQETDLPRLVQELQIHQFELEIQNEELQRARDELATLLGLYTDLYDFAPVGYLSLSPEGLFLQANLAGAALLEVDRHQLLNRRFADFVTRDSRRAVAAFLTKAGESAAKQTCEAVLRTSTNRLLDAHLEAAASDGGGCRVALVDTTEQRRAEAALERSEARYRLLFESSKDGLLLLDAGAGMVVAANPALCQLLGQPAAAFLGKAFWEIAAFRAVADSRQAFVERQGRGDMHHEHLKVEAADGRRLDVELVSHTYRVTGSNVMQVTVRDIGERLRSARVLHETQEQLHLSQRIEAVGRLAGGVAHEFNNQLGVILGHTDLLRAHLPEGAPESRRLDQIEKAARHSAGLTQQLLAFSRKQVLQPRLLAPSALVAEAAPQISRLLGAGVELTLKLNAQGTVKVDPERFQGIVMALVTNARDAMPQGGALTIETADADLTSERAARHEVIPRGHYVTVTVSDSGSGLSAAERSRIFEPFFTSKGQGEGAGLGLAAVFGTVKQSGGYLFVEGESESGASLRIYLPREGASGVAQPGPQAAAAPPPAGIHTVMVVDDEEAACEWIAEALRDEGFDVLTAADGEAAVAVASDRTTGIDLLLTDVLMSGMGGREIAERLQPRWPGMKVLYMSGYPSEELSNRGTLAAGVSLIQKPFTPDELLSRVKGMDVQGPASN